MAAVELKRRKLEVCRRLGQLEEELHMLEEIRDSCAIEGQALAQRLKRAEEEAEHNAAKIDSMTRRSVEMEAQIEDLEREIAILDRRCLQNAEREQELKNETAAAKSNLAASRNEIANATEELETSSTVLVRMDKKLTPGGSER